MATQKGKTSFQKRVLGEFADKGDAKLKADLDELFNTLSASELVEAVIERVQRYAIEASGKKVDDDFGEIYEHEAKEIQKRTRNVLQKHVMSFISDEHRAFIVRCHALNFSTTKAVGELIEEDETLSRLAQNDAVQKKELREILIHRLSYLKPDSPRWSEKKYGVVWREAREEYKEALRDIPLTSQTEQVALLAKHANRLDKLIEAVWEVADSGNVIYPKNMQLLFDSLTKTLLTLQKLSKVDEKQIPVHLSAPLKLSAPQLVGVLERITLALKSPQQQIDGSEAEELVGVLERLTLALKVPAQQTEGNETKALPPPEASSVSGDQKE